MSHLEHCELEKGTEYTEDDFRPKRNTVTTIIYNKGFIIGVLALFGLLIVTHNQRRQIKSLHVQLAELEKESNFELGHLNLTIDKDLIWPLPAWNPQDTNYLAICASIKDQAWDLPEWIRHHYYHLGIHKFYIFDDGSVPPLSDQLSRLELGVPASAITWIYYDHEHRKNPQQLHAYSECVRMFGDFHPWMAFIDGDEFLQMTHTRESIQGFLKSLKSDVGALGVQWKMHNSAGQLRKPPRGACRNTFTTCMVDPPKGPLDSAHIKSIVRTNAYVRMLTPHNVMLKEGYKSVSEDGQTIPEPGYLLNPPQRSRIMLHHYAIKSWAEYQEKMSRGNGMDDAKRLEFWSRVADTPQVDCGEMKNYYP